MTDQTFCVSLHPFHLTVSAPSGLARPHLNIQASVSVTAQVLILCNVVLIMETFTDISTPYLNTGL
jgi:hypothetical protein